MIRVYCDHCREEIVGAVELTRSVEVAPGTSVGFKVVVSGGHLCIKCVIRMLSGEIRD